MLKEEIALDFSQWLHSGPKEMGEGGAFLIAPARERKAKKHLSICVRLDVAGT